VKSGLAEVGYSYVNLDDFWYVCPGGGGHVTAGNGPVGAAVDRYGRWLPNSHFSPGPNGENGIEVVAKYVHSLGLKFGIYVTPGISIQAIKKNTVVLGKNRKPSDYTAKEIANASLYETNYNCGYDPNNRGGNGAMVGLSYRSPGAQDFIGSWADEFASLGGRLPEVRWGVQLRHPRRQGLVQSAAPNRAPPPLGAVQQPQYQFRFYVGQISNGWRTGSDIECCSCEQAGSSYPLTSWANVELRFDQVAVWQPYGRPGAWGSPAGPASAALMIQPGPMGRQAKALT
jgi:hypothetical protein